MTELLLSLTAWLAPCFDVTGFGFVTTATTCSEWMINRNAHFQHRWWIQPPACKSFAIITSARFINKFDGERFRPQRLNEVVRLIFNTGAGSSENKNGQTEEKIDLSTSVARPGFEPRHTEPKSVVLPLYYQAFHSHSHRMGCKNRVAPQLFQIF